MTQPARHTSPSGLPAAVPPGSPTTTATHQATAESGQSRGTNTPRSSSPPARQPPSRVGTRTRRRLAAALSDRDHQVLSQLWQHRYLTTAQLQAFCFTDHATPASAARTTRRVLARLARDHLIRALRRRIGGVRAGSEAKVWQLAPAGARILLPDTGHTWRTHEPSERFLSHTLAVADCHLTLREGQQRGITVAVQTEPTSWRHYTGLGGETRLIRPDLAAHLTGTDHHGTWDDYWFIEIDMGTESLPSLLAKCHTYTDYYTSGLEQAQHGSFPRVLWLMHGHRAEHRAAELTRRIHRTTRLEPRLFTTATPEQLDQVLWGEATDTTHTTQLDQGRKDHP